MFNKTSLKFETVLKIGLAVIALTQVQSLFCQVAPGQDIRKIRNIAEAISENEAMLVKYPDSNFTPNIMFHLVELYVQRAKLKFQREMMIYEEEEDKFARSLVTAEPKMPKIDFSAALKISDALLEKYPNLPFRDKLIYRVALCQIEEGNQDKAFEYFSLLSKETNNKQLLEESYFRMGETFFKQKKYQDAIEHYGRLIDSWDSPYFDMALYKLAWSYYNISEYTKAIGTFIYLIEDVSLLQQADKIYLGKSKTDLRQEAKEYVAICFTEFGGAEKAKEFLADKKSQAYTEEILFHMAEVYRKRNFYTDAISSLNVLIDFYPTKSKAALYQQKIVENYELAGDKENSTRARLTYIEQYGPGSQWLMQIKDENLRTEIIKKVEEYLYALGAEALAAAQETKSKQDYELAISRYRVFIEKFPNSEQKSKVLFYLAECLYEIEKYNQAASLYYKVVQLFPESEFRETAAYNRILAYDQLMKNPDDTDSTFCNLKNILGMDTVRVDTFRVTSEFQSQFLQASNDFVQLFSESPKLPEILMNYAENLYELEQFNLAQLIYEHMISDLSINTYLPMAYTMIGQCAFKRENYVEAEAWFRRLTDIFPDSTRYVEKAQKMIASSKFRIAQNYIEQGDSTKAALEFEKLSQVVYDSSIAERAIFEAALLYEKIGDKNKAITLYEAVPEIFPDTRSMDKALFKAGILGEELEDWNRAAVNYLALFEIVPNSELASKSLFYAGRCYENSGDFENAISCYEKYTRHFFDDTNRYLEAVYKKGEIAYNQNEFRTALREFRSVISSYKKFVQEKQGVEKYLPANAQFFIGEILYRNFQNIKIEPPIDRNLKRKKTKFEQVIKAYTEAAKYKIAEWTTASSYKIGNTFEDFANALLNSPRPKNLKGQALKDYIDKLKKSVLPLKEKALSAYQANVKQAEENNIDNKWIDESKIRMKALSAELGLNNITVGLKTGE